MLRLRGRHIQAQINMCAALLETLDELTRRKLGASLVIVCFEKINGLRKGHYRGLDLYVQGCAQLEYILCVVCALYLKHMSMKSCSHRT